MNNDGRITGARLLVELLEERGVDIAFGYPGGAILPFYDELYHSTKIKHVLVRHEQGAIHMAEGYARATGKLGVCIATSGPGATNLVTGLADAKMDSIPVLAITGQVATSVIGTDAFQEADIYGITIPITKYNALMKSADDIARHFEEATKIAMGGRPGPVLIDFPKDVQVQLTGVRKATRLKIAPHHYERPKVVGNVEEFAEALNSAKRPLLYVGGGAINSIAATEIKLLAEAGNIPVTTTLMGIGAFPGTHELSLGMLGMHGEFAANMAAHETDLLISLGARFDDRVTGRLDEFASKAKVIHIDIDPTSIAKLVVADYPIVGDLKLTVEAMLEDADNYEINDFSNWVELLKDYREKEPLRYIDTDDLIKPQWPIQRVGKILGDNAIISTDVGQHQMWTAQFFPFSHPRQWITSGGLGTMGFGLPAALGAARAFKDTNRVVVNFTGDGSILMNIQELMTCSEYELPVINIVLNNNYLGMVRQWQTMFYENRLAETDLTAQPKFKMLAEAFNCLGYTVSTKAEFDEAFKDAVEKRKPAMIEVIVARNEEVLPMVPNGHSLNEMTLLKGDR